MEEKEFEFKGNTFKAMKGLIHPEYSFFTFEEEEKDFKNKYWNIKAGDIVFDVGASYGAYTLSACAMGATVYAFEPETTVFCGLLNNVGLNGWYKQRCLPVNFGLWSSKTTVNMKDYAAHWPQETITSLYPVDTIDNIMDSNAIPKIDWIKIDVEGAEEHVIKGALNSIKKYKPNLIIECHTFINKDFVENIKTLLSSVVADYSYEEVIGDPCVMLCATPSKIDKKEIEVVEKSTMNLADKKMKIAVILGNFSIGARPLDFWFENIWISSRGLTGTDLSFVAISRELQKLGHDIHMFTRHAQPHNKPNEWEGCNLYNFEERNIIDDTFDAIISINEPDVFGGINSKATKICWQFLNDFSYCQPNYDKLVDVWLGVCEQHIEHLKKLAPQINKWKVLPLGVYENWYDDSKKVPGRMIFCSSADRGLHWALNIFPDIKKEVPEATLKIFYHFEYGDILAIEPNNTNTHPHVIEMAQRLRYCKDAIQKLKSLGVEHVGSVSVNQMKQEMSEASVLLFPVDTVAFSEGFSLSIMQSHMAGAIPIITSGDCIGGIYKNSGSLMVDLPIMNNLEEYKRLTIKALKDEKFSAETRTKCKKFAKQFLWQDIAKRMESIIMEGHK